MIYTICFVIFLFAAVFFDVFTTKQIKKYENGFFIAGCFLLIVMAGIRTNTGYDFQSYKVIFENVKSQNILQIFSGGWSLVVEPGYLIINYLFKGLSFQQFVFIIAVLSISLKTTFINKYVEKKMICLFIYYSMYFLLYDMGIMRQGLAIGILFWAYDAILKDNRFKFFALIVIATLVHSSSVLFIIVYFVKNEKYSRKVYWGILLGALAFSTINIFGWIARNIPIAFIQNKMFYYLNSVSDESIINSIIKRLFILLIVTYNLDFENIQRKKHIIKSFNIFFFSIVLSIIFSAIPILGGRGTGALQIMQLFILPVCFNGKYIKKGDVFHRLIYILVIAGFAYYSMYSLINSHNYLPYTALILL